MKLKSALLLALSLAGIWTGSAAEPAAIPTKTVACIADLRDVNPTNNQAVIVMDYYATRPSGWVNQRRGGGIFRWVTDGATPTEDGGLHIASNISTNGIWERIMEGQVPNVKMWGVKGNDTSGADTPLFQNALTAMRNSSLGNNILIPAGDYYITNTLVISEALHIKGEGSLWGSTIIMTGTNKTTADILRTSSADVALHGNLTAFASGELTNSYGTVGYAHGTTIENLRLQYGTTDAEQSAAIQTGAGLCLAQPGETMTIRNIWVQGGGFGIRAIGAGTPGLKVENSSFFNQSIAGVCIEGIKSTNWGVLSASGPITLSGVSGDLMGTNQLTASLILFSNVFATVSINDLSAEGSYGNGLIRYVMPDSDYGVPMATIKINAGSAHLDASNDLVVITNPYTNNYHSPIIMIEPMNVYGYRYLIRDEFSGRNIVPPYYSYTQTPLHRQVQYESRKYWGTNFTSHFVYGDTAYMTFTPGVTNGWYRVFENFNDGGVIGGKLSINSVTESSAFEFNVDNNTDGWINPVRKSKNTGTQQTSPCITKARAVTYWQTSIGGVSGADGMRSAIEVYVDHALTNTSYYPTAEQREIHLAYPIDGRFRFGSERIDLIVPRELVDWNPNSNYRTNAYESYGTSTGPVSLLR